MKYKLPMFPGAAAPLMLACLAAVAAGQEPSPRPPATNILTAAATRLRESPPFEAKIRQRIDLFGQQLVGSGTYAQAGEGSERFRLELKIQMAAQTTSLTQVCDGRYLWTRKDLGETQHLSHVDLVRVRKALANSDLTVPPSQWMALGGLPGLLEGLSENFDWDEPAASELAQLPTWVTSGRWKNEKLAVLLPPQSDSILAGRPASLDALPAHLPTSVALMLGRDSYLPLFPYRIEFRRQAAPSKLGRKLAADAPASNPVLVIELFEVRSPARLDPRVFAYDAGDQEDHDETEAVIARLRERSP